MKIKSKKYPICGTNLNSNFLRINYNIRYGRYKIFYK